MLPSKAERILSRYRPIAPKPLPLPPSGSFGTTDASSTCASVDSFTSSAKCKKSRKRKADDGSSAAKAVKAPTPIGSGLSNTGGASSLTQGVSDGTVPRRDPRSVSQVSYGSIPSGMEDCTEISNGATKEVRGMASELRFAAYGGIAAPIYVGDAGKMVPTQGLFMQSPEASAQQQHQYSVLHQRLSPGCNPSCVSVMEKDAGFMDRAAAASASVMPERSASLPVCDVGCAKGMGYGGGGFTEMIRGITRLPTAADVQSLMQARVSPPAAIGQGATPAVGSPGCSRGSPTSSREMSHRRLDPLPLPNTIAHSWMAGSSSSAEVDQVCESDVDLVTLPLLPNIPSRMGSLSAAATLSAGSPSALASAPSHTTEPSWHHQVCPRVEQPLAAFASRSVGLSQTGVQVASGCPLLPAVTRNAISGLMAPSMSSPVLQVAPAVADGAAIDESYLEQVYGGSTDPVLLVDENNKALWYNKPYDKALRSASDRLAGRAVPAGPYIDPLGHPTPLGSLVFPVYGKSVRATLWGFLKKLVIQESELAAEDGVPGPGASSQLRLSMGLAQRMSPIRVEPVSRGSPVVCSSSSRVITVTLESITELHMDAPVAAESVEAAEVRLGAGSEPAFITDCLNRVRWVNAALLQMLGSYDGSSSHVAPCSKGVGSSMAGLAEAPAFVICCTEKVPHSAWAFSCRLNLEWIKGGRRRSMTVPCDVTRLFSRTRVSDVSWVWQFDMAASLCLSGIL